MVICAVQPSETIHSVLKHKLLGRIHRTKIRIVPLEHGFKLVGLLLFIFRPIKFDGEMHGNYFSRLLPLVQLFLLGSHDIKELRLSQGRKTVNIFIT